MEVIYYVGPKELFSMVMVVLMLWGFMKWLAVEAGKTVVVDWVLRRMRSCCRRRVPAQDLPAEQQENCCHTDSWAPRSPAVEPECLAIFLARRHSAPRLEAVGGQVEQQKSLPGCRRRRRRRRQRSGMLVLPSRGRAGAV